MKYFKQSDYEFGMDGDDVYITKSPKRSSTSREKPQLITPEKNKRARDAILKFINSQEPAKKSEKKKSQDYVEYPTSDNTDADTDDVEKNKAKTGDESSKAYDHIQKNGYVEKGLKDIQSNPNWLDSTYDQVKGVKIGEDYFKCLGYYKDAKGKEGLVLISKNPDRIEQYKDQVSVTKGVPPYQTFAGNTKYKSNYNPPGSLNELLWMIPFNSGNITRYTLHDTSEQTSLAEKIQTLIDPIAGVPVIGAAGDFANCAIELKKPECNYFWALLYGMGAIPILGEAIAFLKGTKGVLTVAKNAKTAKGAASAFGDLLKSGSIKGIGSTIKGKSLVAYIVSFKDVIIRNLDKIAKLAYIPPGAIRTFAKFFDDFAKFYTMYKSIPIIKKISNAKSYIAFFARPAGYTLNDSLASWFEDLDNLKTLGIQNSKGQPLEEIASIGIKKLIDGEVKIEDLSVENALKIDELLIALEQEAIKEKALSESSIIIEEKTLRLLIRSIV